MLRATIAALLAASFWYSPTEARRTSNELIPTSPPPMAANPFDGMSSLDGRFTLASANTTVIASYTFDTGILCNSQGWTTVDGTTIGTVFWHVDDFVGVNVNLGDNYAPLAGAKSLWCGARASATGENCNYLLLPGYGNNWYQVWQTKACIPVSGNLDVSFLMEVDSEPGYDAVFLQSTSNCDPPFRTGWTTLDGGLGEWDGIQTINHTASYAVGPGPLRVRLRFAAEAGFSDQDGNYDSHAGPVVIDNLTVEGLALETFEDEAVGATSSNDWEPVTDPGYGQHLALFPGNTLLQQDACAKNLSCVWAAIAGSTSNFACGGFPQQIAVPYGNEFGQYLSNEIWSPMIPLTGSGGRVNLQFTVYRDLPFPQLVFYVWDVRSFVDGCPSPWRSRGFVNYGAQKDWFVHTESVGEFLDLANASHIQVRIGVLDQCGVWCSFPWPGNCHSHAPLIDNVRVYRVDMSGPIWSTRDVDMFQDTFPSDGTDTGIGRADAALSLTASSSPTILPGDSTRVIVRDPVTAVVDINPTGLADDNLGGGNGNKACYLWVHVIDSGVPSGTKTGAILSGGARYPFKDTQVADGKTWTRIQCWLRVMNSGTFVVDLNDNLFEAGDVVEFFFSATNTNGETTYCSGSALNFVQDDLELAAETASEFSILPVVGNGTEGNDILYVDGMDGRGGQEFWDIAFQQLNRHPDRYDVRAPTSTVPNGNTPGSRVADVSQQLHANYSMIFWDTGDLSTGLGDGLLGKANDYGVLNAFLGGAMKGIYLCGDDAPTMVNAAPGTSAITFRTTFITYSLTTGDHRPSYGIAPTGTGVPGSAFAGDTWVIHGGCPLLNDFDVMTPSGSSVMHSSYGPNGPNNGAEVGKITGTSRVMLSGYSFIYLRDDEADGVLDRTQHLRRISSYLGHLTGPPVGADPIAANRLEQNYPNPFNPQTTIAFSLKQAGRVRIDIYNVAGARVRTLLDENRPAGSHADVRWDGTDDVNQPVASGVYWYRLVAGSYAESRKMVLLK